MTEPMRLPPGSVILTPGEAQRLRDYVHQWREAYHEPGDAATAVLVEMGQYVREVLDV